MSFGSDQGFGMLDPEDDGMDSGEMGGGADLDDDAPAMVHGQPTMAELEAQMSLSGLKEGTIVEGTVVRIDSDGVLVDVGTKSEGLISPREFSQDELEVLAVGDKISVFVVSSDDEEGNITLSKKRADHELNWKRILAAYESGEVVECTVVDRVRGGLRVDLGVTGFIPASHVGVRNPNELDRFVGEVVCAKIIEIERARKKVILSRRLAEREVREKSRETVLTTLKEGQVRDGVIRNVTNYGAFVDLGGVDGLLHITELDWIHVKHPSEVLHAGMPVQVMVLKIDKERGRISLSRKQLLPDPWHLVGKHYRVGQALTGPITRCVSSGAFLRLPEGVEAFIPVSELSNQRVDKPEDIVKPGTEVTAKVINVQPKQRRMTLSLAQAVREAERAELDKYMQPAESTSGTTLGDVFGAQLRAAVGVSASDEAPAADDAVVDEPIADEPVVDEPIADEPVVDEPIAEEPVSEEPTAEEPVSDAAAATGEAADAVQAEE